mmetsp:Transcript_67801/g.123625  ORF Transcript_67801/g.123625 Transcript_67801/m.123625 type:complete len:131 (+) Transcript_67801:66-458(+)
MSLARDASATHSPITECVLGTSSAHQCWLTRLQSHGSVTCGALAHQPKLPQAYFLAACTTLSCKVEPCNISNFNALGGPIALPFQTGSPLSTTSNAFRLLATLTSIPGNMISMPFSKAAARFLYVLQLTQ